MNSKPVWTRVAAWWSSSQQWPLLQWTYNQDGYGEHTDGRPFDGTGICRAWPLLVGERGHLALQSGEDPLEYLHTMLRCASAGGLLPEQV
jgi:glucoamylase